MLSLLQEVSYDDLLATNDDDRGEALAGLSLSYVPGGIECDTLSQEYAVRAKDVSSDMFPFFPILTEAARKAERITEFGIRYGNSAIALIAGKPKTFTSVDFVPFPTKNQVGLLCKKEGIDFTFVEGDTRRIDPIADTDLLFVDTCHTGPHLYDELIRHAPSVTERILLHDTLIFGEIAENKREHGLWWGIKRFLEDTNGAWEIEKVWNIRAGLTALVRAKKAESVL